MWSRRFQPRSTGGGTRVPRSLPRPPPPSLFSVFLGDRRCRLVTNFLAGREGKSWAIRAGGATGQVSWATTTWGREKDGRSFSSGFDASQDA